MHIGELVSIDEQGYIIPTRLAKAHEYPIGVLIEEHKDSVVIATTTTGMRHTFQKKRVKRHIMEAEVIIQIPDGTGGYLILKGPVTECSLNQELDYQPTISLGFSQVSDFVPGSARKTFELKGVVMTEYRVAAEEVEEEIESNRWTDMLEEME